MPKLEQIVETALYVDDIDRASAFYEDVMQLRAIFRSETLIAFGVGGRDVLLLFKRGAALKTQHLPGGAGPKGEIPPHDGSGPLHVCFAIAADDLAAWEARLEQHGIGVEGRTEWSRGGRSVYFRDPSGHLLELMTPGNWPPF